LNSFDFGAGQRNLARIRIYSFSKLENKVGEAAFVPVV